MLFISKDEKWINMENMKCCCGETIEYEIESVVICCKHCGAIIELV